MSLWRVTFILQILKLLFFFKFVQAKDINVKTYPVLVFHDRRHIDATKCQSVKDWSWDRTQTSWKGHWQLHPWYVLPWSFPLWTQGVKNPSGPAVEECLTRAGVASQWRTWRASPKSKVQRNDPHRDQTGGGGG